jgi:hypothetical protein
MYGGNKFVVANIHKFVVLNKMKREREEENERERERERASVPSIHRKRIANWHVYFQTIKKSKSMLYLISNCHDGVVVKMLAW